MPHHFTKNTESVSRHCNTCGRTTMWSVSSGRLGRCMEDHHKSPQQQKAKDSHSDTQGSLFQDISPAGVTKAV